MSSLRCLYEANGDDVKSVAILVPSPDEEEKMVEISYAQLCHIVDMLSNTLGQLLGQGGGESVSLVLPNSLEFVCSFLSLANNGYPVSPLNPNSSKTEFMNNLADMKSIGIVVPSSPQLRKSVALDDAISAARQMGLFILEIGRREFKMEIGEVVRSSRLASQNGKWSRKGAPQPNDIALLLQTSGTTSKPKVVPLTHKNILTSVANIVRTYSLSPSDRTLVVMPLFHVHGLIGGLFSTLFSRGSAVIPIKFSAGQFLHQFLSNRCSWYTAVPTIHKILLSRPEFLDVSRFKIQNFGRLRFVRSCSSSLAPATLLQLESVYGVPILEAYAMTEAAHQMTSNPLPPGQRKLASVGLPQGVNVGIFDKNNDPQPTDTTGEVCIWGDNVTSGYIGNPDANNNSFFTHGGRRWFRTGDQGYLNTSGYLHLTGRLKELINRAGEKISPLEIDEILLQHPAVAEAVAFPLPHKVYGEEVYAATVLKQEATEAELKHFCARRLAAFKSPKRIFIASRLPQTPTGKIQRRHVADHFEKLLQSTLSSKL